MSDKFGKKIVAMITSMALAKLLITQKISVKDKEPQEILNLAVSKYVKNCFDNGVQGARFKSDYWQNSPGWAVSLPEIIAHNGTIYIGCRWWKWYGGFVSQAHITSAKLGGPDEKGQEGWIIFLKGVGHTPNSQWFLAKDGTLFEYVKEVKSHDPVHYMPTGETNVGWTETVISADLEPADLESSQLSDLMEVLKTSVATMKRDGLRPIMKMYFSLT